MHRECGRPSENRSHEMPWQMGTNDIMTSLTKSNAEPIVSDFRYLRKRVIYEFAIVTTERTRLSMLT